MPKYYHPQSSFFKNYNLPVPSTAVHGSIDDINEKMTQLRPNSWRMEGPGKLVGDTEMGKLVQFVDPSYICTGTDDDGNPVLQKITV